MEKKIEVRNLCISFRTNSGTVKAVRNISFTMEKGETLAIVGESGSGKSVTAKAILGILAANSIVEGGEIFYDGQDLLKISEEEFNELRGHRIAMIYQDPLSSLDPIMKIGKQMTEATIMNGKTARKHGKKRYNEKLSQLEKAMHTAGIDRGDVSEVMKSLRTVLPIAAQESVDYHNAYDYTQAALTSCEHLRTAVKKQDSKLIANETKWLREKLRGAASTYILPDDDDFAELVDGLPGTVAELEGVIEECLKRPVPEIYAGTYCTEIGALTEYKFNRIRHWNKAVREVSAPFYNDKIITRTAKALETEFRANIPAKQAAADAIKQYLPLFSTEELDLAECKKAAEEMIKLVNAAIDRLTVISESSAYTFEGTMRHSLKRYTKGIPNNKRELRRVARDEKKHDKIVKRKGDAPSVIPAVLVDMDLTRDTMLRAMNETLELLTNEIETVESHDFRHDAERLMAWLREQAERMKTRVSKKLAYDKAIHIMEDVGIAEPRKRFTQYPFEFSGGMRQRIVIAIAVAANPDILICDEPTTALDVTIQSQILELINELKRKRNLTVIFITHDLGVVANIADKVAVMYAGQLVEYGTSDEVFYEPAHPYTWALLSSMPDLDTDERLESIPGTPPNMIYPPKGDAFAARNKYALAIDFEQQPPKFRLSDTHWAATWLLHPKAPKVEMPSIISDRIARMKAKSAEYEAAAENTAEEEDTGDDE